MSVSYSLVLRGDVVVGDGMSKGPDSPAGLHQREPGLLDGSQDGVGPLSL